MPLENLRNFSQMEVMEMVGDYLTFHYEKEPLRIACDQVIQSVRRVSGTAETGKEPKIYSLEEFLAAAGEEPPALVADFLPSASLLVLGGIPKLGKTLFAMEILYAVSSGERLFGRHEVVSAGPVLYFGFEDGAFRIAARLRQRGQETSPTYFLCKDKFDMSTESGMATFEAVVAKLPAPPSLIVIDTARYAYLGIKQWNDAAEVGNAVRPLAEWAHEHCCVLLVAHNNKDRFAEGVNKISGSNALPSTTDGWMILENQRVLGNGDLLWEFEMAGRAIVPAKHRFRMDTHTLRVHQVEKQEWEELKRETRQDDREQSREKILAIAGQMEAGFTVRGMAEAAGFTEPYTRQLVRELVAAGRLAQAGTLLEEGAKKPSAVYMHPDVRAQKNGAEPTGETPEPESEADYVF